MSNLNYLIHIQHSIRLLLEQQIANKEYFNIIAWVTTLVAIINKEYFNIIASVTSFVAIINKKYFNILPWLISLVAITNKEVLPALALVCGTNCLPTYVEAATTHIPRCW